MERDASGEHWYLSHPSMSHCYFGQWWRVKNGTKHFLMSWVVRLHSKQPFQVVIYFFHLFLSSCLIIKCAFSSPMNVSSVSFAILGSWLAQTVPENEPIWQMIHWFICPMILSNLMKKSLHLISLFLFFIRNI